MAESLSAGKPPIAGTHRDVDQPVTRFVEVHFATQDARNVEIDMLAHLARRPRVSGQFDNRLDRIADNVALPCREEVIFLLTYH